MPLYEYAPILKEGENSRPCCTFESLQKHTDAPLTQCPTCGHIVTRLISNFGIAAHASPQQSTVSQPPSSQNTSAKLPTSNTAAGRVLNLTAGHVCHAGCKH